MDQQLNKFSYWSIATELLLQCKIFAFYINGQKQKKFLKFYLHFMSVSIMVSGS